MIRLDVFRPLRQTWITQEKSHRPGCGARALTAFVELGPPDKPRAARCLRMVLREW
jgi:hypothetical protein